MRLNAIRGVFKLNRSQINVQLIKTNSSVKQISVKSPSQDELSGFVSGRPEWCHVCVSQCVSKLLEMIR